MNVLLQNKSGSTVTVRYSEDIQDAGIIKYHDVFFVYRYVLNGSIIYEECSMKWITDQDVISTTEE